MFTPLPQKFPLGSKFLFHSDGKDTPFTVIGFYISDMGRECVIALFEVAYPEQDIAAGEAIVLDTLYISGPAK